MKKLKLFSVFALVALLLSAGSGAVMAQDGEPPSPREATRVSTDLPDLHEGWPIVRVETWKVKDETTGQAQTVVCVYRRRPSESNGKSAQPEPCSYDATTRSYDCYMEAEHHNRYCYSSLGDVTIHQYGTVDNYKRYSQSWPTFYKVKYIDIWWTRSDTSWDVEDAESKVGYPFCTACAGGGHGPYSNEWDFDPSWMNDTRTYTYQWEMFWSPKHCTDAFGGWTEAEAWEGGTYRGETHCSTTW